MSYFSNSLQYTRFVRFFNKRVTSEYYRNKRINERDYVDTTTSKITAVVGRLLAVGLFAAIACSFVEIFIKNSVADHRRTETKTSKSGSNRFILVQCLEEPEPGESKINADQSIIEPEIEPVVDDYRVESSYSFHGGINKDFSETITVVALVHGSRKNSFADDVTLELETDG